MVAYVIEVSYFRLYFRKATVTFIGKNETTVITCYKE